MQLFFSPQGLQKHEHLRTSNSAEATDPPQVGQQTAAATVVKADDNRVDGKASYQMPDDTQQPVVF